MEIKRKYKYVHEDVDRHGNVRVYFWRGKGHQKLRIKARPGSNEFEVAYQQALAQDTALVPQPLPSVGRAAVRAGTLRWLCVRYLAESADFLNCTAETQRVRRRVIEAMLQEPRKPGAEETFADFPLDRFTGKAVTVLRDRKREAPETANVRLKALRKIFAWAIESEIPNITMNPARDVKFFRPASDGHHTWAREEVAAFSARHPPGTRAHLAMSIMLYTGVRISDLAQMGPQMIRDGWIHFTEVKGRSRKVKKREIPILPELQTAIEAFKPQQDHFMVTEYGKPFSVKGLSQWFSERCNEAGLSHCTAHGLRKAGATIAAENGATEHELMAIFGWENPEQAAVYTRKANRRHLVETAIRKITLDR